MTDFLKHYRTDIVDKNITNSNTILNFFYKNNDDEEIKCILKENPRVIFNCVPLLYDEDWIEYVCSIDSHILNDIVSLNNLKVNRIILKIPFLLKVAIKYECVLFISLMDRKILHRLLKNKDYKIIFFKKTTNSFMFEYEGKEIFKKYYLNGNQEFYNYLYSLLEDPLEKDILSKYFNIDKNIIDPVPFHTSKYVKMFINDLKNNKYCRLSNLQELERKYGISITRICGDKHTLKECSESGIPILLYSDLYCYDENQWFYSLLYNPNLIVHLPSEMLEDLNYVLLLGCIVPDVLRYCSKKVINNGNFIMKFISVYKIVNGFILGDKLFDNFTFILEAMHINYNIIYCASQNIQQHEVIKDFLISKRRSYVRKNP